MARPTDYDKEYHPDKAFKLSLFGMTDKEMADVFDVAESTFHKWKLDHDEFSESIKRGKSEADADIVKSLYERARGYSHKEDKIFCNNGEIIVEPTIKHYPPDTAAAFIWLKNRQSGKWRDKSEVDQKVTSVTLKIDKEDENL